MGWSTRIVIDKLGEGYGMPKQPLYWEDFNEKGMTIFDINKQNMLVNIMQLCREDFYFGLSLDYKNGNNTGYRYVRLTVKDINTLLKKENVDEFIKIYEKGFWSPTKTPKKYFNDVRKEYISALKCAKHILTIAWFGRVFIVEG